MKGVIIFVFIELLTLHAAILPPPWADPDRNPCASQPGGWLLIYWPPGKSKPFFFFRRRIIVIMSFRHDMNLPDKKCYRIFQRGYPCPETMELNPMQDHFNRTVADCRCPPRTAQILNSDKCYEINTKGPCEDGEYFAPLRQSINGR